MNKALKEFLNGSIYLLVVLSFALFFITFIAQRTVVDGSSMNPTLIDKDSLVCDKVTYRFKDPERFDIIVFYPHEYDKSEYYIKRVIGLPGEEVRIDDAGNIYINGEILDEHYGAEVSTYAGKAAEGMLLGPDEFFVMGDNRNHSMDGRDLGPVNKDQIMGKTIFRIFPIKSFGKIYKNK